MNDFILRLIDDELCYLNEYLIKHQDKTHTQAYAYKEGRKEALQDLKDRIQGV